MRASATVLAFALMLATGQACAESTAPTPADTPATGVIPEGIWVLDQEKSRKLSPSSHTLWVLRDDGRELSWVSVETGADGKLKVTSWTGLYGGEPSVVSGSGFVARLRATGPRSMETYGDIPDMGAYSEKCAVQPSGTEMLCNGQVTTEDGVNSWFEHFVRAAPSPHLPLRNTNPQGD